MNAPKKKKASVRIVELDDGRWRVNWEHVDYLGAKRTMTVEGRSLPACLDHVAGVLDNDRTARRRAEGS